MSEVSTTETKRHPQLSGLSLLAATDMNETKIKSISSYVNNSSNNDNNNIAAARMATIHLDIDSSATATTAATTTAAAATKTYCLEDPRQKPEGILNSAACFFRPPPVCVTPCFMVSLVAFETFLGWFAAASFLSFQT